MYSCRFIGLPQKPSMDQPSTSPAKTPAKIMYPAVFAIDRMSGSGQTRKSALVSAMSAFPPIATKLRTSREVRFVPNTEVSALSDYMAALAINR